MELDKNVAPYFYMGSVLGGEGEQGHFAATGIHQTEAAAAIAALAYQAGGNFTVSEETGVMSMPVSPDEFEQVQTELADKGNVVQSLPFGVKAAEAQLGFAAVDAILGR